MNCKAEAGVAGPIKVVTNQECEDVPFPGDPRVTRFAFGPRPAGVRDLRIRGWITVEFEIADDQRQQASFLAREFLERVADIASVTAGINLPILYWQVTSPQIARPTSVTGNQTIPVDIAPLARSELTERHYRALRHLRRGLAQTSPEKRFSSLMLALSILARFWAPKTRKPSRCVNCGTQPMCCQSCGAPSPEHGPGDRDYLLNLVDVLDNCDPAKIELLWDLRNKVVAHGNEPYTPETALRLVESSMDAAIYAYAALNASLPGLALDGPAGVWFITDVFLLEDSIAYGASHVTHIAIEQIGHEWSATWPAEEARTFTDAHPLRAINQAKQYARKMMRKPIKDPDPSSVHVDVSE